MKNGNSSYPQSFLQWMKDVSKPYAYIKSEKSKNRGGSFSDLFTFRVLVLCVFLVTLSGLLASCSATSDPVLPTLRPTFTPSLEPSATFTRVFNPTATPTEVHALAISTAGPSPTPIIGQIPTHPIFTPTATLINYAPGTLQIEYFTTDSTAVRPGDKLTLYWSAHGVDKAVIYRLDEDGKRGQVWNVNRAGSLDVGTKTTDRGNLQFVLTIGNVDSHIDQTLSIPIGCVQVWFFDPQPDGCPATEPDITTLVQQNFERGQMIWVQSQLRIYILFNDGQQPAWAYYPDEFKDGQQESDPSLSPPGGLLQPIRGFGLIWRGNPRIKQRLGWATEHEVPSNGALQGDATTENGTMYLRGRDGNIFGLFNKGESWKLIAH